MQTSHPKIDFNLEEDKCAKNDGLTSPQEHKSWNEPHNMFNDASSIKYSQDNQNLSNFSIPTLAVETMKPRFDGLDGMCYDLISAFVGDRFPTFIFANKQICNTFVDFQLEINDEVLAALGDRANQSQSSIR